MTKQEFEQLATKIADGIATKSEIESYNAWFNTYSKEDHWEEIELGPMQDRKRFVFENIEAEIKSRNTTRIIPLYYKIAVAASLALFAISGIYYLLLKPTPTKQNAALVKNDIAPGHNQATLTLANGKKIILTKGLSGLLAQQGGTSVNVNNSNITYNSSKKGEQISYNTLSTAKGEQSPYPLVLPDGTKVWLNAESSITFPTAFNGRDRMVKITGEALFEVAHNAKQPFKVQASRQTIEDIGTTFNVNAYADEPSTTTTLIEGKVKVNHFVLKPGQQTDGSHIRTVNTDTYTAWKEGNFHFEGDDIHTIMRQLARWYAIEVSYEGTPTTEGFYGDISRSKNISAVLTMIGKTNAVHFKITGRRVTVIP